MGDYIDHHFPVGTLDEVKAAGMDPRRSGACCQQDDETKGCDFYPNCVFAKAENGGFRDLGPKNVGVSQHLGEWPITQRPNEDFLPCYRFMATMWKRMTYGHYVRENEPGKPYDDIRIIAQEGEPILVRRDVSAEPGSLKNMARIKTEEAILVPKLVRVLQAITPDGAYAEVLKKREELKGRKEPVGTVSNRKA